MRVVLIIPIIPLTIMFIMPFMSFMNFMWPKPEPGAVMCGWNDMSAVKFGDGDLMHVGRQKKTQRF